MKLKKIVSIVIINRNVANSRFFLRSASKFKFKEFSKVCFWCCCNNILQLKLKSWSWIVSSPSYRVDSINNRRASESCVLVEMCEGHNIENRNKHKWPPQVASNKDETFYTWISVTLHHFSASECCWSVVGCVFSLYFLLTGNDRGVSLVIRENLHMEESWTREWSNAVN